MERTTELRSEREDSDRLSNLSEHSDSKSLATVDGPYAPSETGGSGSDPDSLAGLESPIPIAARPMLFNENHQRNYAQLGETYAYSGAYYRTTTRASESLAEEDAEKCQHDGLRGSRGSNERVSGTKMPLPQISEYVRTFGLDGSRPAVKMEQFNFGPGIRRMMWTLVLRSWPATILWPFYCQILTPTQFRGRIHQKVSRFRQRLMGDHSHESIIARREKDEHGIAFIDIVYVPADQGRDRRIQRYGREQNTMRIKRDPGWRIEYICGFIHDLVQQGIPARHIAEALCIEDVYSCLFGAYDPERKTTIPGSGEIPIAVQECLNGYISMQEQGSGAFESMLESNLDNLIEHAPNEAIRFRLVTFQRTNFIKGQNARYLHAKNDWFSTWFTTFYSTPPELRSELVKINELALELYNTQLPGQDLPQL